MGKTDLTISLPSDFFVQPKYLFVFCGTLKLSQICNNSDANTFDYHSFLFATSYLMINDSFLLQLLKSSGTISFHLNDTILPTLYVLLNLNFALPWTLSWFESKLKFYNHHFVSGICHLPYQAFRGRFLNFEHHNKWYQEHFFNDFLGHAHCTNTCDICIEHDSTYYSRIDFELSRFKDSKYEPENSKFRPLAHCYKLEDQLFQCFTPAVTYHKCIHSCTLPVIHKPHFYRFWYKTMLIYTYYTNLTSHDKALHAKCHSFHNDSYNDVFWRF